MKTKKVTVVYTASFAAEIEVPADATNSDILEAAGDVDIPEGGKNKSEYQTDSFDIEKLVIDGDEYDPNDMDEE